MPHSSPSRCFIGRLEAGSFTPAGTAGRDEEMVLVVEVGPARSRRTLQVEFLRGADQRDFCEQTLSPSTESTVLAFRLCWRDRTGASPRLTCRVRLDGRVVGCPTVLLTPAADAQGRFDPSHESPMSEPTRLAFLDAFARLLDHNPEPRRHGRRHSDGGG